MPIDLQEIINRITLEKNAQEAVPEPVPAATEPAPVVAEPAPVVPAATPAPVPAPAVTEPTLEEQQKVAAEMDEAGRVMARAFHDELYKLAVGAHGYVETKAEDPASPAQISLKPERQENAMKAVSIIQQLTAGERLKGPEGYIQVNGQPTVPTAPELPVEEHPTAYDQSKNASAKIITAVYNKFFGGN
jgi:hypothetical protein